MRTRPIYLFTLIALLAGLLPLAAVAGPAAPIEQALLDRLAAEGSANFFVKMALDADLSAAYGLDWQARGEYVVDGLRQVADATQGPVIDYARQHGLAYQSYWVNNSVEILGGDLDAAYGLAALPGVAYLRAEHFLSVPDPVGAGLNGFQGEGSAPAATTAWGILDTKADDVWATYGVKGMGIKVANIDTGVQWNHPALDQAFACPGAPSDPRCWADPSNICGGSACDNNGHGTHTMGTMVADDDPGLTYIAGMAPDATWIACKGCETNSCSDTALIGCAQWLLQPGGSAANRPNVVNNSWGGGGGDTWYRSYVQSWVAAAIFPAFSAGNSGSSCSTLGSPGDYQESLASAAHDSARNVASFSSRGPSAFGHEPYTKPNISAPGVSVCSTVPTNGWSCSYSGTSMASPHTAGAVALIWSGCPALLGNIDITFQTLQNNANTPLAGNCGAPPDGQGNYTYGYGYLDALAAVASCYGGLQFGTLQGHVYDENGSPIANANVGAVPGAEGTIEATTDPNGFYTMQLVEGTYDVTASKTGYSTVTVPGVVIVADQTTVQDFTLESVPVWMPGPSVCFDFTRLDGEYYAGTGKAYILGGRGGADGSSTFGDIYAFDPVAQTCVDTGANLPTPISNYTVVPLNDGSADLLCTFGGRDSAGTMIQTVQCYNPLTNAVVTKANLPAAFSTFLPGGAAAVGNKAIVFGGFRSTASPYHTNVTYEYDPVTNAYTAKGNLALGRGYMDVAVVDGKVYAFGGDVFDGVNLVAQTKTEVYDPATGTWNDAAVAELPTASGEGRAFGFDTEAGTVLDGKAIVAGGGQWPNTTLEVYAYDVATNAYDYSFPDLITSRRNHAGFYVPGMVDANGVPGLWVVGGRTTADTPPYGPAEYYNVAPSAPPVDHYAHLYRLKMNQRPAALPGWYKVITLGIVHDEYHVPVAGITVEGTWTYPDGSTHPGAAVGPTNATGQFKFRIKEPVCGLFQFDVTGMSGPDHGYDPAANHVSTHIQIVVPCR